MNNHSVYVVLLSVMLLSFPGGLLAKTVDHHDKQVNDSDVKACLKCHDNMEEHSHPVMISYPPKGEESSYAPLKEVEKSGVKIMEGKITCITCHDLSNSEEKHPIKGLENSRLCLVCHRK